MVLPGPGTARTGLKKGKSFLLVLDCIPSMAVERAQAVLPTGSHFERSPVRFINQEGRLRNAFAVHRGRTPIIQVSGGKHPPRSFLDHIPGGDAKAAHEVLAELCGVVSGKGEETVLMDFQKSLSEAYPVFTDFSAALINIGVTA